MEVKEFRGSYQYWAFISYSHKDQRFAQWLHRRLEAFRVPGRLRSRANGSLQSRQIAPIFLDSAELAATHDLSAAITAALDASRFLVLVASPAAARSVHVAAEIEHFLTNHAPDRILTVIATGHPNAESRGYSDEEECFPVALRAIRPPEAATTSGTGPYAADARGGRVFRARAVLRLAAGLLGVGYDSLKGRRHRYEIVRIAVLTAIVCTVLVLWQVPQGKLARLGVAVRVRAYAALLGGRSDPPTPWLGSWVGVDESSCGNYSGPVSVEISMAGPHQLRLSYNAGGISRGSYLLTYDGNEAVSNGIPGTAYYTIDRDTMKVVYPETCQTGTLKRQIHRL
ncbi:MAG: toll/interleukin-1 receptor domain-containing protein [Proteobacteria bacterium]|nr:toll/interleukin-1 receptor domain-containing protein [Pseudomonadota bacterium]